MPDINDLRAAIRQHFHQKGVFSKQLPSFRDVVRRVGQPPNETRTRLRAPETIEILRKAYHPIPASPKRAEFHRIAYVYPHAVPSYAALDPALFAAPLTLRRFPPAINDPGVPPRDLATSLARKAATLDADYRGSESHIISGQRGVGKTAFLNYLFSTQFDVFDEHKVIWVRGDLTLIEATNWDLVSLLQIHAFDIICRYYLGGGNIGTAEDYASRQDYATACRLRDERKADLTFEAFQAHLEEYTAHFPLDAESLRHLQSERQWRRTGITPEDKLAWSDLYLRFMRKHGYSYIFVIDGLDEATVPMQRTRTLDRWRPSLMRILQGKGVPNGLYLVCARDESFRQIANHVGSSSVPRLLREWIVWPVEAKEVLTRRLDLFEYRLSQSPQVFGGWTGVSARFLADCTEYAIRAAFKDLSGHFDPFEDLSSSGHMRELLKFFRDALWETAAILEEEYPHEAVQRFSEALLKRPDRGAAINAILEMKAYRMWSIASLCYGNYFERSAEYDGISERIVFPSDLGDLPLVPVVWGDIEFEKDTTYFANHLLTKIRVLEFLKWQGTPAPFRTVRDTIAQMFSHDPSKVDILIRLLVLQRLVDLVPSADPLQGYENAAIRLTDFGGVLLDTWVLLPEYVEGTMHLAAVPDTVAEGFPRFMIQRAAGPLSGDAADARLKTPAYLAQLVPAWAKFAALVDAVERWETTRFRMWARCNPDSEHGEFRPRRLAPLLRERLLERSERILQAAAAAQSEEVIARLSRLYLPKPVPPVFPTNPTF